MPLLTVLAPGTAVVVDGMHLPNAVIERVILRTGRDPIIYELTWRDTPTSPARRASFRGDRVQEADAVVGAGQGQGRLGDLGRLIAAQAAGARP